jgi:hypothetical protein
MPTKQYSTAMNNWNRARQAEAREEEKSQPSLDTLLSTLSHDALLAVQDALETIASAPIFLSSATGAEIRAELLTHTSWKPTRDIEAALALVDLANKPKLSDRTVEGLMASGLRPVPWVKPAVQWGVPPKYARRFEHFKVRPSLLPLPLCSQPDVVYHPPARPPKPRFTTPRPPGPFSL